MILELIKNRAIGFSGAIQRYPGKKKQLLKTVLEAARWAPPTHKKTQPWRFKVITGESKEKLGLFLSLKYMETDAKPKQMTAKKLIEKP